MWLIVMVMEIQRTINGEALCIRSLKQDDAKLGDGLCDRRGDGGVTDRGMECVTDRGT